MEAVPPPEETTGEQPAVTEGHTASQAAFGGWEALRNLIWGTPQFMRLWLAQLVTSTGEWVFFLAVAIKAAEVGPGTPEGAVALVLLARLGPGFFFGEAAIIGNTTTTASIRALENASILALTSKDLQVRKPQEQRAKCEGQANGERQTERERVVDCALLAASHAAPTHALLQRACS